MIGEFISSFIICFIGIWVVLGVLTLFSLIFG